MHQVGTSSLLVFSWLLFESQGILVDFLNLASEWVPYNFIQLLVYTLFIIIFPSQQWSLVTCELINRHFVSGRSLLSNKTVSSYGLASLISSVYSGDVYKHPGDYWQKHQRHVQILTTSSHVTPQHTDLFLETDKKFISSYDIFLYVFWTMHCDMPV